MNFLKISFLLLVILISANSIFAQQKYDVELKRLLLIVNPNGDTRVYVEMENTGKEFVKNPVAMIKVKDKTAEAGKDRYLFPQKLNKVEQLCSYSDMDSTSLKESLKLTFVGEDGFSKEIPNALDLLEIKTSYDENENLNIKIEKLLFLQQNGETGFFSLQIKNEDSPNLPFPAVRILINERVYDIDLDGSEFIPSNEKEGALEIGRDLKTTDITKDNFRLLILGMDGSYKEIPNAFAKLKRVKGNSKNAVLRSLVFVENPDGKNYFEIKMENTGENNFLYNAEAILQINGQELRATGKMASSYIRKGMKIETLWAYTSLKAADLKRQKFKLTFVGRNGFRKLIPAAYNAMVVKEGKDIAVNYNVEIESLEFFESPGENSFFEVKIKNTGIEQSPYLTAIIEANGIQEKFNLYDDSKDYLNTKKKKKYLFSGDTETLGKLRDSEVTKDNFKLVILGANGFKKEMPNAFKYIVFKKENTYNADVKHFGFVEKKDGKNYFYVEMQNSGSEGVLIHSLAELNVNGQKLELTGVFEGYSLRRYGETERLIAATNIKAKDIKEAGFQLTFKGYQGFIKKIPNAFDLLKIESHKNEEVKIERLVFVEIPNERNHFYVEMRNTGNKNVLFPSVKIEVGGTTLIDSPENFRNDRTHYTLEKFRVFTKLTAADLAQDSFKLTFLGASNFSKEMPNAFQQIEIKKAYNNDKDSDVIIQQLSFVEPPEENSYFKIELKNMGKQEISFVKAIIEFNDKSGYGFMKPAKDLPNGMIEGRVYIHDKILAQDIPQEGLKLIIKGANGFYKEFDAYPFLQF